MTKCIHDWDSTSFQTGGRASCASAAGACAPLAPNRPACVLVCFLALGARGCLVLAPLARCRAPDFRARGRLASPLCPLPSRVQSAVGHRQRLMSVLLSAASTAGGGATTAIAGFVARASARSRVRRRAALSINQLPLSAVAPRRLLPSWSLLPRRLPLPAAAATRGCRPLAPSRVCGAGASGASAAA